jgi:hypothetical protein
MTQNEQQQMYFEDYEIEMKEFSECFIQKETKINYLPKNKNI